MANSTTLTKINDSGKMGYAIDSAKTLAIADNGVIQNVIKTAVITLPAAVVGYTFTIRNGGALAGGSTGSGGDASVGITITPNGTEYISGCNLTSNASDLLVNTLATSKVGDEVTLVAAAATGWTIEKIRGTWAITAV